MRPLEIALLAAGVVAFAVTALALPGKARRLRHLAVVPLALTGAQVLVEGPRWQMVPAYALGGLFFLAWFARLAWPARTRVRHGSPQWVRRLGLATAVTLGALGLAVSIALPAVFPVFRFPPPTGPYGIGTVTYHWVDADRPEVFTADPSDRREVVVQLWYPAADDPSAPRAAYVPDADLLAPLARLGHLPGFTLGHLKYVTTNAIPDAPVASGERSYPLLILAGGRGGYRQYNTLGVEELVSHGYIVASIDHPYAGAGVTFPDGRQATFDSRMLDRRFVDSIVPFLTGDAVFTLDQMTALNEGDPRGILTGRIDLQHVGLFGLSLGGEITAEGCMLDQRFRACIVMDAWMPQKVVTTGLTQPTMWLTRDAETMRREGWSEGDIERTLTTMLTVYGSLPGPGYIVQVRGMFHPDFGDTQLLSPLLPMIGISGPIDGARAHRILNAYTLAFFDRHLRNRTAQLLDGPAPQYPEVIFNRRS